MQEASLKEAESKRLQSELEDVGGSFGGFANGGA